MEGYSKLTIIGLVCLVVILGYPNSTYARIVRGNFKVEWYGRTKVKDLGNGYVRAYKYAKPSQPDYVLRHEIKMINKEAIKLGIVLSVSDDIVEVDPVDLPEGIEINSNNHAVVYTTKKEYFNYFNDKLPDNWDYESRFSHIRKGALRSISQLATLLKDGYIHTTLSPMTHRGGDGYGTVMEMMFLLYTILKRVLNILILTH